MVLFLSPPSLEQFYARRDTWPEETRRGTKIKAKSPHLEKRIPRVYLPLLRTPPQWESPRNKSSRELHLSRIILVSFFDERSFDASRGKTRRDRAFLPRFERTNVEGIRGHAKWRFMRLRVFLSPCDSYSLRNFIRVCRVFEWHIDVAHNGDNWLPLDVTRRDVRGRGGRRREETRAHRAFRSSSFQRRYY